MPVEKIKLVNMISTAYEGAQDRNIHAKDVILDVYASERELPAIPSVNMVLVSPWKLPEMRNKERADFHDYLRYHGISEEEMEARKDQGEVVDGTMSICNYKSG